MGKRVLLADDSATIQKLVEMALSDTDFQLLAVSDGKQAIDQLEAFQPDVILADAIMPQMDGYDVCHYVKSHSRFRNIPVILLTGRFQPFDEKRAAEVAIDDRVVKPFSQTQLVSLINASITKAMPESNQVDQNQDAPIFDPAEFATPEPSPPGLSFDPLPEPTPEPTLEPEPDLEPKSAPAVTDFGLSETPSFADEPFSSPAIGFEEPSLSPQMSFENETVRIDPSELPEELRGNFPSFNSEPDDSLLDPHRRPEPPAEVPSTPAPEPVLDFPPTPASEPVMEMPPGPPQQEFLETTMELTVDDLEDIDEVIEPERAVEEEPMELGDDDLEEVDDLPMANFDTGPVEMLEPQTPNVDIDTAPVEMMAAPTEPEEEPMEVVEDIGSQSMFEAPLEAVDELEETEDIDPHVVSEPEPAELGTVDTQPMQVQSPTVIEESPAVVETEDPLAVEEEFSVEFDLKPDTESEEQLLDEVEVGDTPGSEWQEPEAISAIPEVEPEPIAAELAEPQPFVPEAPEPLFQASREMQPVEPVVVPDSPEPIDLGSVGETFEAPAVSSDMPLEESLDTPSLDDSGDMLVFEEDDSQPSLETPDADDFQTPTQKLDEAELVQRVEAEMQAESPLEEQAAETVSEPEAAPQPAAPQVSAGTITLSENQMETLVDRIAARVIERLGKDSIRDIAWEVIPDLSEALIKKRIYQLENSVDEE